jgi:hypothetical protein
MTTFFSVSDNSFYKKGFPWITTTIPSHRIGPECPECHGPTYQPRGDLDVVDVLLDPKKGSRWPDLLGSGDEQLFIVSERLLDAWRTEGVGEFPASRLRIMGPLPKRLQGTTPPAYWWIQGDKLLGARLDLEASGWVDVRECPRCGRRRYNISATFDRQHSAPWSYMFVEGSWNGTHLFTTNLSPACFFCTEAVVDCARKHRLTNFRFIPVEEGDGIGSPGLPYLQ